MIKLSAAPLRGTDAEKIQTVTGTENPVHCTLDAEALQAVKELLGLAPGVSLNAIEVEAEVVDVMDGVIGGNDVSIVPALLDFTTGRLALVNKELGHPLLVWDEVGATVHYCGRQYSVPVLEDSVPADLWRTEISDHIQANGYWAVLDLRALIA